MDVNLIAGKWKLVGTEESGVEGVLDDERCVDG